MFSCHRPKPALNSPSQNDRQHCTLPECTRCSLATGTSKDRAKETPKRTLFPKQSFQPRVQKQYPVGKQSTNEQLSKKLRFKNFGQKQDLLFSSQFPVSSRRDYENLVVVHRVSCSSPVSSERAWLELRRGEQRSETDRDCSECSYESSQDACRRHILSPWR